MAKLTVILTLLIVLAAGADPTVQLVWPTPGQPLRAGEPFRLEVRVLEDGTPLTAGKGSRESHVTAVLRGGGAELKLALRYDPASRTWGASSSRALEPATYALLFKVVTPRNREGFWPVRGPELQVAARASGKVGIAALALGLLTALAVRRRRRPRVQSAHAVVPPTLAPIPEPQGLPVVLSVIRGAASSFPLVVGERTVIGSRAACDLRVDDREVAPEHCELQLWEGRVLVRGLSTTLLNGVPVQGRCRVESGDTLRVGATEFRIGFEDRHALSAR